MKLRIQSGPAQGELVGIAATPLKNDEILGYEITVGQVATVRVGIKVAGISEMGTLSASVMAGVCAAITGGDPQQTRDLAMMMNVSIVSEIREGGAH